jgi:hypothetical protein
MQSLLVSLFVNYADLWDEPPHSDYSNQRTAASNFIALNPTQMNWYVGMAEHATCTTHS